jgi:hypothetical protein
VESQATSRVTAPTEGRQKVTGARNEKTGHQETNGNRQEGRNGDRETTEKPTGVAANHRETSEGWRKRADASEYIKPPPITR